MSGLANAVRGEAELLIGGVRRILRPTFAALVAAEQELGPLFAMVERAAAGSLSLQELATLFFHCLEDKGADHPRDGGRGDHRDGDRGGDAGAAFAARPDPAGAMTSAATSFSVGAARLAGLAGALLGWRPAEFWAATPAELAPIIAALGESSDAEPATRASMLALQETFPDG